MLEYRHARSFGRNFLGTRGQGGKPRGVMVETVHLMGVFKERDDKILSDVAHGTGGKDEHGVGGDNRLILRNFQ